MDITLKITQTLAEMKGVYRYHFGIGANEPVTIQDIEGWLEGMIQADIDDINSDDEITEG